MNRSTPSTAARSLSIIRPIHLTALLFLAIATGCGDDTPAMGDEGVEKEIAVSSPAFNIINILRATGNSVKVTGKADRPFFKNAKGYTMLVNNGVALEVYEFESAEDLETSAATVSADGANVEGKKVEWDAPPHFYKTDKVIIIYVGNDADNQRELASVFGSQFAGR